MQQGKKTNGFRLIMYIILLLLGIFSIITQLYFSLGRSELAGRSLSLALVHYFSYFTIITNMAIVVFMLCSVFFPNSKLNQYFSKKEINSGLALYILIVGLIYNLLLKNTWNPQGLEMIADGVLHDIIPALYLLTWFLFMRTNNLIWSCAVKWLIFPAIYFIYIIVRGEFINEYPYHFLDVLKFGYSAVLLNALGIGAVIYILGIFIVAIDKFIKKN